MLGVNMEKAAQDHAQTLQSEEHCLQVEHNLQVEQRAYTFVCSRHNKNSYSCMSFSCWCNSQQSENLLAKTLCHR